MIPLLIIGDLRLYEEDLFEPEGAYVGPSFRPVRLRAELAGESLGLRPIDEVRMVHRMLGFLQFAIDWGAR